MKGMPVVIEGSLPVEDAPPIETKRWTRDECQFLEESGLIDARRYELIEGELIVKVSKNHPHMMAVKLLTIMLHRIFGEYRVMQEPSIHLHPQDTPLSDPEPDVVVLTRPFLEFRTKAEANDIVLLVEVSVTSLRLDANRKAALYARAGIADYWVLDVNSRRLLVHREPFDGAYRQVTAFTENEPVSPLAAPIASIRAADLL
jgi:Uma2 family endonuclease